MSLKDKSAVIIGGLGGIGFEIGKHLLRNGISVRFFSLYSLCCVLFVIDLQKLFVLDIVSNFDNDKRAELQSCNMDGVIFYKQCDITKKDQMDKLLRSTIVQKLHFIDIFVNAAGIIDEQNPEQVVAVNLV